MAQACFENIEESAGTILESIANSGMMCTLSIPSAGTFETGTDLCVAFDDLIERTIPQDDNDRLDWFLQQHMTVSANQSVYTWIVPYSLEQVEVEEGDTQSMWTLLIKTILSANPRGVYIRQVPTGVEVSTIASTITEARRALVNFCKRGLGSFTERSKQFFCFNEAQILTFKVPICDINLGTTEITMPLPTIVDPMDQNVQKVLQLHPQIANDLFGFISPTEEYVHIGLPTKTWKSKCDCGSVHEVPLSLLNDKASLSHNPALYCHTVHKVHAIYKTCTCGKVFFLANDRAYTACPTCKK